MAYGNDLQSLVGQFVSQLQDQIRRQVESELAGKIDAFKASLLGGVPAPARVARVAAAVVKAPGKRGPRSGYSAAEKPCPFPGCGKMNKARRFSYLCEEHRSDENRKKYRGAAGTAAPAAAAPAGKALKRGPGRPKGSKNKPKTAATSA